MSALDTRRLALVTAARPSDAAHPVYNVGTGYFVTGDLLLTAAHVIPEDAVDIAVRTEGDGTWRSVRLPVVWRHSVLDAVLLRVEPGLGDIPHVAWLTDELATDVRWQSSGYPIAGNVPRDGGVHWKQVGLSGTLQVLGGGGQGLRELDLTVEAAPPADQWAAVSGAPVFVGDRLAGFIKEAPSSFEGRRLAGVSTASLLQEHGFRLALSRPWLQDRPQRPWMLVVLAERKTNLAEWIDGVLVNHADELADVVGAPLEPSSIKVKITDAIASPGQWLQFVEVLCHAPIVIFDATESEPAIMLALGVRAVVRRGVTITSTAELLTPARLSALPFNIQETKLVYHGGSYKLGDERHPLKMIPAAIKKGWQELQSLSRYLDLPAYDAVRCPFPSSYQDDLSAVERILVLCSFRESYEANWVYVANALALHYPLRKPVRMLDVFSPRLVGQALYEGIRWSRTCVVDWTEWRANVFFELGVRLACGEAGAVGVIDRRAAEALAHETKQQHGALFRLFAPTAYDVGDDDSIRVAFARHDAIAHKNPPVIPTEVVPHDATYNTCIDAFDWAQEPLTFEPHDALRRTVQEPFGKDHQAVGRPPVLFSANPTFRKHLERGVQERWIAAWHYLAHRYPEEQWQHDAPLRAALRKLGNEVLQFGLRDAIDPHLVALKDTIYETLDRLSDLDDREAFEAPHVGTD